MESDKREPDDPRGSLEELIQRLGASDFHARFVAIMEIGSLGEAARPAIPALLRALDGDMSGHAIGHALQRIDPTGAERRLREVLNDRSAPPRARAGALSALGTSTSPDSISALLEALSDQAKEVREVARHAIPWHPEAKRLLPAVIDTLKRGSPHGRAAAAHALGRWGYRGDSPPETVPALIEALKDPEPAVRREALESLRHSGSEGEKGAPVAAELLRDPDDSVRAEAARLFQCKGRGDWVLKPLRGSLLDRSLRVRVRAALALAFRSTGHPGPEADALRAVFLHGIGSNDAVVRVEAIQGLSHRP